MFATPYVDNLSIFVRVAIDRPNAVARLLVLFEIEQGADGIPVCIVILGRYVLKDELLDVPSLNRWQTLPMTLPSSLTLAVRK